MGARERWRVTYDTVTEESAMDGEFSESGWALSGGWKFPVGDKDAASERCTLRAALQISGRGLYDAGRWFATSDADIDFATGKETLYAIHPPENITRASYRRVARLLTGRN